MFNPLKELSKFFIIMAMAAVGLNTNIVKLVKTGGKPILMGMACWIGITGKDSGAFIDLLDQEHRCFCTFLDFF